MPSHPHHLLLVATKLGYQTRAFAAAAERLGVRCTLATDRCGQMDDPWADGAVPIHFDDPTRSVARLKQANSESGPFTAIAALADTATFTAALFAQSAGIAFHPPHAVEAARNKFLSKERFRAAGLPQPEYRRYGLDERVEPFTLPCVLKPIGLSGSRGVIRANTPREFEAAFSAIRRLLADPEIRRLNEERNQWIQVESYIPGEEFAIEGIVTSGKLHVLAIFDKPDPLNGPYFEETIYVTPSSHSTGTQAKIVAAVSRGVEALGLCHGPVHAEVRNNGDGAWLLEIGPRPIGGYCAKALQFASGMGLEELILRHAVGEPVEQYPLVDGATGVMMIPIPRAGVYRGVQGVEQARTRTFVTEILVSAAPGQRYKTYPDASSYLGFIFARAGTPAQVEAALRHAHGDLRFDLATELI